MRGDLQTDVEMGVMPDETAEHYLEIAEDVSDEVVELEGHPIADTSFDRQEWYTEFAGEVADDIATLQEAGAENALETSSFWSGVAAGYELERFGLDAAGVAHNVMEQVPEQAEEQYGQQIVSIEEAMDAGMDHFERGFEQYEQVLDSVGYQEL